MNNSSIQFFFYSIKYYYKKIYIHHFLKNKKNYVFITSDSSSIDGSLDNLRKKYNNINFISGKRFNINFEENELFNWINK